MQCLSLLAAVCAEILLLPVAVPPRDVFERAQPRILEIRQALEMEDAAAVRTAVQGALSVLGRWAGVPEIETRYYPPIDPTPFSSVQARELWLSDVQRGLRRLPWAKNPTGDPAQMQAGLREAALPLDALARTARLFPETRPEMLKAVREGGDWLIRLQHDSGVFPFPVGPGLQPRDKVGHIVAKMIRAHPELVIGNWIPDDRGDGGLQFDNGLCGRAMVSAWELTGDARYLVSARKSAEWAIGQPLVSNWNYNAFSVGLLARLAAATDDQRYLAAAVHKADAGVLPGQMPGGRWFDPHNASAVYHNILLRELLELLHALPPEHSFRPVVLDAVTRGLDQAAEETVKHGYSGTWTDNFARGLHWVGEEPKWRTALNVCLNSGGRDDAPKPGFALITVLEELASERK